MTPSTSRSCRDSASARLRYSGTGTALRILISDRVVRRVRLLAADRKSWYVRTRIFRQSRLARSSVKVPLSVLVSQLVRLMRAMSVSNCPAQSSYSSRSAAGSSAGASPSWTVALL